eukprot:COSAG05_NODE_1473_length_4788_cov_2.548305_2_plen_41_part_00
MPFTIHNSYSSGKNCPGPLVSSMQMFDIPNGWSPQLAQHG